MEVTYAVVKKTPRGTESRGRSQEPPRETPAPSSAGDSAYEVVTPQVEPGSSSSLGFNFRIGKPKGPRAPPMGWDRG